MTHGHPSLLRQALLSLILSSCLMAAARAQQQPTPATKVIAQPPAAAEQDAVDYGPALQQLIAVINDELQRDIVTGMSIALVDGQNVVMTAGFGWASRERQVPASAQTAYRVGSISKLFTALATMQLVEQGKLDLDAPITKVLPSFRIVDPFPDAEPITLRQLMCHRSGLVRESPVGGYLDDSQPGIAASVASLESCVLVNPPNTKTRYSNIGVTVEGQAVAAASGLPFEQYQRSKVLDPLGMIHSSWRIDKRIRDTLATGYMRVADGQGGFYDQPAPEFELGTIPAGNLYSTAEDMALFAQMLLADGKLPSGEYLVQPGTLAKMAVPQLIEADTGFGLGFHVGKFGDYQTIRHTGAVYGFSTSIVVLPKAQVAAVVLASEDIAAGRVKRISDTALDLMLNAKFGRAIAPEPATVDLGIDQLTSFIGQFESASYWAEIHLFGNQIVADISGQPMTMRPVGPNSFEIDGRYVHRGTLEFQVDEDGAVTGFEALGQRFAKVTGQAATLPPAWRPYLGGYGPEFIPLVISWRHGHLYAMTENMVDYRMTPVTATVFAMPEGLYADEHLVFQLDPSGRVHAATLANMTLRRLPDGE